MFLYEKSIACVLVVLQMQIQKAAMTYILYNCIYSKNINGFRWQKKSISRESLKPYCLHSAFTDAHYILTYMVQGQWELQNNEYKYLNLSGQTGLHHHVVWD